MRDCTCWGKRVAQMEERIRKRRRRRLLTMVSSLLELSGVRRSNCHRGAVLGWIIIVKGTQEIGSRLGFGSNDADIFSSALPTPFLAKTGGGLPQLIQRRRGGKLLLPCTSISIATTTTAIITDSNNKTATTTFASVCCCHCYHHHHHHHHLRCCSAASTTTNSTTVWPIETTVCLSCACVCASLIYSRSACTPTTINGLQETRQYDHQAV